MLYAFLAKTRLQSLSESREWRKEGWNTAGELCPKLMIWTQFSLQLTHSRTSVMSFITYEAISSLLIISTHNKTRKDVCTKWKTFSIKPQISESSINFRRETSSCFCSLQKRNNITSHWRWSVATTLNILCKTSTGLNRPLLRGKPRNPMQSAPSSFHSCVTHNTLLYSLFALLHLKMGKSSTKSKSNQCNTHFNFARSWNPLLMYFSHKAYEKHLAYCHSFKPQTAEQFLVRAAGIFLSIHLY